MTEQAPPPPPGAFDHSAFAYALLDTIQNVAQQLPSTAPPPVQVQTTHSRNYTTKPEPYDGDKYTYAGWKQSVDLYVSAIASAKDKIRATLSFLTLEHAAVWNRTYFHDHQTEIADGTLTWEAFTKALDERFKDPRVAEQARKDLQAFRMGNMEARAYFVRVDDLRTQGELTNAEHHDRLVVENLERNMPADLVLAIASAYEAQKNSVATTLELFKKMGIEETKITAQLEKLEGPISYVTFRDLALQQDPHVRRARPSAAKAESKPAPPPPRQYTQRAPNPATTAPTTYVPHAPTPVQTSAFVPPPTGNPPGNARTPDVIPMEVDRTRYANRRCFTCNKLGHLAAECPQNPQSIRALDPDLLRRIAWEMENEQAEQEAPETERSPEDF